MAKTDFIYEEVTNKIIAEMEKGNLTWLKEWKSGFPINAFSKKFYKGVNALLLNLVMQNKGYTNPTFLTYKQAQDKGGYIRKGEKGYIVVFWKVLEVEEDILKDGVDTGETRIKKIPLLRYHTVFNIEQTEGIEYEKTAEVLNFNPIEKAEEIIKGFKDCPKVEHKGIQPLYNRKEDFIMIPLKENFNSEEAYYSTFFHEAMHSTGHKSRVDRGFTDKAMTDKEYAKEEIIAELGTAFLTTHSGIANKTIQNNSAYINAWLDALKEDKKFIFKISKDAQKGCDYILGVKEERQETGDNNGN